MTRFSDFREIAAKFDSVSTDCGAKEGGHNIRKGETIGYAFKGHTVCPACWSDWCRENAQDDFDERFGFGYR